MGGRSGGLWLAFGAGMVPEMAAVFRAWLALCAILALGCGARTEAESAGGLDGSVVDAVRGGPCPPSAPAVGSPCPYDPTAPWFLSCSYGDDVVPCRRRAFNCNSDGWVVYADCGSTSAACPAAPPFGGTHCDEKGALCGWSSGTICHCMECALGIDPCWRCFPRPPGCPPVAPNAGDPCDVIDKVCTYGEVPGPGVIAHCERGTWQWRTPLVGD